MKICFSFNARYLLEKLEALEMNLGRVSIKHAPQSAKRNMRGYLYYSTLSNKSTLCAYCFLIKIQPVIAYSTLSNCGIVLNKRYRVENSKK